MNYEKKYIDANNKVAARFGTNVAKEIFTDLYESEDEKIRKELLSFCQNRADNYPNDPKYKNISAWIAWLEKQGEQKPFDYENANIQQKDFAPKQEPKFNVGDWIVDVQGVSANQIIGYEDDSYHIKTSCSKFYLPMKLAEKNYHLWTIQDAKDGDVLFTKNKNIFIFKSINDCTIYDYCGLFFENFIDCSGTVNGNVAEQLPMDYTPATKEQRDTLMKAMANAGYTFDFEKKELKKIEQKSAIEIITPEESLGISSEEYNKIVDECIYGDDKSNWGKEDEQILDSLPKDNWELVHEFVEKFGRIPEDEDELNVLVEYVLKRQKHFWSEEDEEYINDLIGVFDGQQYQAHSDEEVVKWLKSIRLPYNKEWDENDEEMLRSIIATCELAEQDRDSSPAKHLLKMQTNWLKSLKGRRIWKPSDEQMKALWEAYKGGEEQAALASLYSDLKKLKGE